MERTQRDRYIWTLRQNDLALKSCLADNNKIRRKFGLDPVTADVFFAGTASSRDIDFFQSMTSSFRDEFFDAEEADSDQDTASSCVSDAERPEGSDSDGGGVADDDDAEFGDGNDTEISMVVPVPAEPGRRLPTLATEADRAAVGGSAAAGILTDASKEVEEPPPPFESAGPSRLPSRPKSRVAVQRRKALPAPTVSMENLSILSILRNNVGKDLSTVAMPILLNEPINLLQRLAEELEYSELIESAARSDDPVDRIALVAAFAVSGYASTVNRPARKPFNPLLGETYELVSEERGFRYLAEKVSHHPPIMVCHAESDHYLFAQDNLLKTKFWGKSMELIPSGTVTTCMRNVFSNGRYLEHYGTMNITCQQSGLTCVMTFKESGYFVSAKNEVVGSVVNSRGEELVCLSGKWDDAIVKFHSSTPNNLQLLWRARPCPPHHPQMYGFTAFTVELNELTPDLAGVLPPTDTRFRPDQRLYEEGRADEAEHEKQRLEQKQRERRKKAEASGMVWLPQYFELRLDPGAAEPRWHYKGGYWEMREKGAFETALDLFS
ncbi:hypothetical protein HK405_007324 [Cladochytrium tenue]|nr:hypothetical protein HK405_007324 [Cladochytrium tenue]